MNESVYKKIKEQENIIETNRLEIRKLKKEKYKLFDLKEVVGNIYEYMAAPLCAISITMSALLSGSVVYILPSVMSAVAVGFISCKYVIDRKINGVNDKISDLKEKRQLAYDNREMIVEEVFIDLKSKQLDDKDYYNQLVNASNKCHALTDSMVPLKNKKSKLSKIKDVLSLAFDYILAPFSTIALPLICSLTSMDIIPQIALMGVSSAILLGCASVDEHFHKEIEGLNDEIDEIKSDRTVNYVKRDLKLDEALKYLKIKNDSLESVKSKKAEFVPKEKI